MGRGKGRRRTVTGIESETREERWEEVDEVEC